MTDNLRDRIAAALLKEDQLRVCKLSDADIRYMTDAVMAVLREVNDEIRPALRDALASWPDDDLPSMTYRTWLPGDPDE
jgi:enolase